MSKHLLYAVSNPAVAANMHFQEQMWANYYKTCTDAPKVGW